jgi:hypothetical protein
MKPHVAFTIFMILWACDKPTPAPGNETVSTPIVQDERVVPNGAATKAPLALDRRTVMRARRKFQVKVLSFDASQQYGTEFPYSDRVRLKITNNSDVTLPCLTVLTKRYSNGEIVGSSRAPSVPTLDIAPGESVEYDYYPRGHLDVVAVERIRAEVESVVGADEEEFICELQGLSSESPLSAPQTASQHRRINIGTPADSILAWRGRAIAVRQTGQDEQGLLVEWRYPNAVYLLGRRVQDGVEAYRVIKVTTTK